MHTEVFKGEMSWCVYFKTQQQQKQQQENSWNKLGKVLRTVKSQ